MKKKKSILHKINRAMNHHKEEQTSQNQDNEKYLTEESVDETPCASDNKQAEPSLEEQYAALNDNYLRLFSEFDNYRKRSLKERVDLIKTASESVVLSLLPVLDDFERALQMTDKDQNPHGEGMELIYNKLKNILCQAGLREMDTNGVVFDPDLHEAIAQIPVEDDRKGKVIEQVQKGYYLHDKLIRFAKVVVGAMA